MEPHFVKRVYNYAPLRPYAKGLDQTAGHVNVTDITATYNVRPPLCIKCAHIYLWIPFLVRCVNG